MRDQAPAHELSVIVPVLRDSAALGRLLAHQLTPADEWIVVDGAPGDPALADVRARYPAVTWLDSDAGRGHQIRAGVAVARGAWVLVLHADTRLAPGWRDEVTSAARAASYEWGCFRLRLDTSAWQARLIEAMVRLRVRCLRLPYGDQAMFFRRDVLEQLGSVPAVPLMEDVVLARRFGRRGPPYRAAVAAVTSARRWERDGWWRRTARNWWLMMQYLCGVPPERLVASYRPERPTGTT